VTSATQVVDWLQGSSGQRAARISALLLGVWIIWRSAALTWLLVPAPELPMPPVSVEPQRTPTRESGNAQALSSLQGLHLFGVAAAPAAAVKQGPIDAPETRLNLTLKGALASDVPEEARAIIAAAGGEERTYAIGAEIPGGARLSEIYPDRVILERGGRYETLRLPRDASALAPGLGPQSTRGSVGPQGAGRAVGRMDTGQLIRDYREKMAQNPAVLLDIARPEVVREQDRFLGFKLHPGNRRELFAQLGLQDGDVVTEVNGIQLDDPGQGAQVLESIREGDQLSLTVRRRGEDINLAFSIP